MTQDRISVCFVSPKSYPLFRPYVKGNVNELVEALAFLLEDNHDITKIVDRYKEALERLS